MENISRVLISLRFYIVIVVQWQLLVHVYVTIVTSMHLTTCTLPSVSMAGDYKGGYKHVMRM